MNDADRLNWLQAESLALQTIVLGLCRSLNTRTELRPLVDEAFYHADDILQAGSLKLPNPDARRHFRLTLHIVEQLRTGIQGKAKPTKGV